MKKNPVIDSEFFYGATPEIFHRASQLRQNMTVVEKMLWAELKAKKTGFTFRRQHPINLFIADFYCHKVKLAVEIDGSIHDIECVKVRDEGRKDELEKFGILIIRFTNEEVIKNLQLVISKIQEVCIRRIS
jgi:very-short-patch-repair endonuclease